MQLQRHQDEFLKMATASTSQDDIIACQLELGMNWRHLDEREKAIGCFNQALGLAKTQKIEDRQVQALLYLGVLSKDKAERNSYFNSLF